MRFVIYITTCDSNKVLVPFHLENDSSRTWMFEIDDSGLRFRHDHRHSDGTPEEQNLYGGYANQQGTEFAQHFPSDDYTNKILGDSTSREWRVILAPDLSLLSYQLFYSDSLIFQADFDLTKPL